MKITEITQVKSEENKKIRHAPYCRVSSDSADQKHSFATQIKYFMDYCKRNPEYELVDIYADEGISGTSMFKRDEFNRMILDCENGKIDRIITKSVSRFARNTEELLLILRKLKSLNVSVYFEEQDIDTNRINAEMIVTFPGMAAEQESRSVFDNLRWSCRKRMEQGEFFGNYVAYGYKLENKALVINEDEAVIVREIFDMYLNGIGKSTIAQTLNRKGVPTRENRKAWYTSTISYILTNERYKGDSLLQKKFNSETLPHKHIRNKGQLNKYYIENSHPPIIERDIFDKVQEIINFRSIKKSENGIYPLSKKLICPDCGSVFKRQIVNGKIYWLCRKSSLGQTNCKSRRLLEKSVCNSFVIMLNKIIDNKQILIDDLISNIQTMIKCESKNNRKLYEVDLKIADLGEQNYVISRLHSKGLLDDIEFNSQSTNINNQITELRFKRKLILKEDSCSEWLKEIEELNEIISLHNYGEKFSEELFGSIVKRIVVIDNATLQFELLGRLKFTEKMLEKERCRSV